MRPLRSRPRSEVLAAGLLVIATAILVTQFLQATPTVVAGGERIGISSWQFSLGDAVVIAVGACAAGASATVLLSGAGSSAVATADTKRSDPPAQQPDDASNELLQARRREWETTSERLASNEKLVYQTVLDADGVLPQSEIGDRTDLSKATVSRTLDSLEARDLVERKRRGMGNIVLLT